MDDALSDMDGTLSDIGMASSGQRKEVQAMARLARGCSIYMRFGKKVKVPINPEELTIQRTTDNKAYDVLGVGQIVVPKKPSLKVISWEGLFPWDDGAPYVGGSARSPGYYVKMLESAMKGKKVGRLIISRSGAFDTNMRCIISSFETKDKGGGPGDVYYSVEFTEHRSYGPQTVQIITTPAPGAEAPAAAAASSEAPRPVEAPVMRVGAQVIVNGEYCYSSFGAQPHKVADNLSTTVTRIVSTSPYPICVGQYGWVQEGQLQIVG